jgi:hypothetical protein
MPTSVPEPSGSHERPEIRVAGSGFEASVIRIPGKVDPGSARLELNAPESVGIRRAIRDAEPLIQEERKSLVNSVVELRNPVFGHHRLRLSAFMV